MVGERDLVLKKIAKDIRSCARQYLHGSRISFREISYLPTLIIAPHPDDETLGVGGLIAFKKEKKVPVKVIFFTSGEASHISCCNISKEDVASVRRQQALGATAYLGLNSGEIVWQDLQDGKIPCDGESRFGGSVRDLAEIFQNEKPAEIYCPHPNDGWADHRAATEIILSAVQVSRIETRIIYYIIWAWYNAPSTSKRFFNWDNAWKLNIGPVFEKKISAICYYMDGPKAPCGYPYCGKLPWAVIHCAKRQAEIFIDGGTPNH